MQLDPCTRLMRIRYWLKRPQFFQKCAIFINLFVQCKYYFLKAKFTNSIKSRTILFYPDKPLPTYLIYQVVHYLGYRMTININQKSDLVVAWQDRTFREHWPPLNEINARQPVLNLFCTDISKTKVEQAHLAVFGFGLKIDPLTYTKICIRKSDQNAAHDGKMVQCPIKTIEPGFVYQRVINNEFQPGMVQDIRLTVMQGKVVFCFLSNRPMAQRFDDFETEAIFVESEDILSEKEIKQIFDICNAMHLDLGVLDAVRDQDSGKLYVLDVNNTPVDPPGNVVGLETEDALSKIAMAFYQTYF